ncbi:hypothetical protein [Pseudobacteriovorax antillogorgiicola]|uniref:Lipoprotein n=1 Tax=Pseudobacteriovorax antillogorgiicola TaxID=1513793 RepID=A0A1Y6CM35_9BACT|nr:hypothetical protein [Pseudobacteriovorax antillogorgiicola]TCS45666.1 hypothetical protein EDD56_12760 [Pseudobacteriovorax antillogorgiicola]SMF73049.1 hypothetical protein SAMN06296036_12759 [Pseudobacteriovorax antillogorgiicola]
MRIINSLGVWSLTLGVGACGDISQLAEQGKTESATKGETNTLDQNRKKFLLADEIKKAQETPQDGQVGNQKSLAILLMLVDPEVAQLIDSFIQTGDEAYLDEIIAIIDDRIWSLFEDSHEDSECEIPTEEEGEEETDTEDSDPAEDHSNDAEEDDAEDQHNENEDGEDTEEADESECDAEEDLVESAVSDISSFVADHYNNDQAIEELKALFPENPSVTQFIDELVAAHKANDTATLDSEAFYEKVFALIEAWEEGVTLALLDRLDALYEKYEVPE